MRMERQLVEVLVDIGLSHAGIPMDRERMIDAMEIAIKDHSNIERIDRGLRHTFMNAPPRSPRRWQR